MEGRNSNIMRAMSVRKLLIWLICLLLFAQSDLSVTPAEIDANDRRDGESCQVSALEYRKEQSSGRGSELCLYRIVDLRCRMYLRKACRNESILPNSVEIRGRSLSSAVREITAMVGPVAHQHGINLQAILDESVSRKRGRETANQSNACRNPWCLCSSIDYAWAGLGTVICSHSSVAAPLNNL